MGTLLLTLIAALAASWLWRRRDRLRGGERLGALLGLGALVGAAVLLGPRGLLLQKVLGRLAMPVGLLWAALGLTAFLSWHSGRRRAAAWQLLLWLGLTLSGNDLVAATWMGWLQRDFQGIRPLEQAPFDAVVVLGGGTLTTVAGDAALSTAGDRVVLAARMYRAGLTTTLVTSGETIEGLGPPRSGWRETSELWSSLGVPASSIVVLRGARNTSEEIRGYRRLLASRGWTRVGLISSAWHLRRALRLCRTEGLTLTPLPADQRLAPFYAGLYSLIPNGQGFADLHLAAWETLGAAVGR